MHFLRVNVTFYEAVSMIRDVITSARPFPYTAAKFMLTVLESQMIKVNESDIQR